MSLHSTFDLRVNAEGLAFPGMARALRIERGSDLVLYSMPKECALKLEALGEAAGRIDYGSVAVAVAVHRFDQRLDIDKSLAERLRHDRAKLKM